MSNEDLAKYKSMIRNIPRVEAIPKINPIPYTERLLKHNLLFGFGILVFGSFVYKLSTDLVPGLFNPTTKKFMAIPDFTSRQVHVFYREVPNRAHEY